MKPDLKKLVQSISGKPQDRLRVLVALNVETPSPDALERLRNLGLTIERILPKTILGSVEQRDLPALAGDPVVREVERSQRLEPNS